MKSILRFSAFLSFLAFFVACNQSESDKMMPDQKVENRDGIYYAIDSDQPYNGVVKYYNRSGTVRLENEFKDGLTVRTVSYDQEGAMTGKSLYKYRNGKRIATTTFYPDGSKQSEQTPEFLREWYANGQIKSESFYNEEGLLTDTVTLWDSTGTIIDQAVYENGRLVED